MGKRYAPPKTTAINQLQPRRFELTDNIDSIHPRANSSRSLKTSATEISAEGIKEAALNFRPDKSLNLILNAVQELFYQKYQGSFL